MIVGVDPGIGGGVAVLDGETARAYVMPPLTTFAQRLREQPPEHVFIERAQAMPKQGVTSMFTYGRHFGELLGVLVALRLQHTLVRPRDWCRAMHVGTAAETPKHRSLEACERLFPHLDLRATTRSKKPHTGIVDALCIAEYGRRILRGQDYALRQVPSRDPTEPDNDAVRGAIRLCDEV